MSASQYAVIVISLVTCLASAPNLKIGRSTPAATAARRAMGRGAAHSLSKKTMVYMVVLTVDLVIQTWAVWAPLILLVVLMVAGTLLRSLQLSLAVEPGVGRTTTLPILRGKDVDFASTLT